MDEFWFWVSPTPWPAGPRIFDGVGPVHLELIGATTFGSDVVRLAYRRHLRMSVPTRRVEG